MGLPVARVRVLVYVLSALLTGVAGVLVAAQTSSGLPTIGEGRELEAIAAVVIGGTLLTGGAGSLGGTLAGVLLLKVIQNLINQVGTLTVVLPAGGQRHVPDRRGADPVPSQPAGGCGEPRPRGSRPGSSGPDRRTGTAPVRVAVVGTGDWWGLQHARAVRRPRRHRPGRASSGATRTAPRPGRARVRRTAPTSTSTRCSTASGPTWCRSACRTRRTSSRRCGSSGPGSRCCVEKPLVFVARRGGHPDRRGGGARPVLRHQLQPPLRQAGAPGRRTRSTAATSASSRSPPGASAARRAPAGTRTPT